MDNTESCKYLIQEIKVKKNLLETLEHERSKVKGGMKYNELDMFGVDCG